MDNLLDMLQKAAEPIKPTPECREKQEALKPYHNAIQKAFSLQFLDRLLWAEDELHEQELRENFRLAYRLGGQAVLAVLTPPETAPDTRRSSSAGR